MYKSAVINGKLVEYKKGYIEGEEKTTILVNGVEVSSNREYPDGSFDKRSRTILKEDDLIFDSPIKLSENFRNFTARQEEYNVVAHTYTDTDMYPLINSDGMICGEGKTVTTEDIEKGEKRIVEVREIENQDGNYRINSSIQGIGGLIENEEIVMRVENKQTGAREDIRYTKNSIGNETYIYMENGVLQQRVTKKARGTTIDVFDEHGQPTDTYEYDENGNALVALGNLQQLPDDYVKSCLTGVIPESTPIINQYAPEASKIQDMVMQEKNEEEKETKGFER